MDGGRGLIGRRDRTTPLFLVHGYILSVFSRDRIIGRDVKFSSLIATKTGSFLQPPVKVFLS